MNFKTTIILLLLLVVVGVYIYFFEFNKDVPDQPDTTNDKPGIALFKADEFPTESATLLTIRKAGEKDVVIAKESKDWFQTEPVHFKLNEWDIKNLIDAAATLRSTETITPGKKDAPSLKDMQLDPPAATIVIKTRVKPKSDKKDDDKKTEEKTDNTESKEDAKGTSGGTSGGEPVEHTIEIGRLGSGGDWGYVRIAGKDEVYVVTQGSLHKAVLSKTVADWRDKRLGGPEDAQVTRVSIDRDGATLAAEKAIETGAWSFAAPAAGRADKTKLRDVITGVSSTYVHEFKTDEPKDLSLYGLDRPSTVVTLVSNEPNDDKKSDSKKEGDKPAAATKTVTHTLRIGAPSKLNKDYYYATYSVGDKVSSVVFDISKSDVEKFGKKADDLRDARITTTEATQFRKLSVERGELPAFALMYDPEGWQFAAPDPGYKADSVEAYQLIEIVAGVKAKAYIANAKVEGDPAATLTISASASVEPEKLKLFAAPDTAEEHDKRWLVLRNDETTGYLVAKDDVAPLFEPVRSLRSKSVLELDAAKLTQVTIKRPDGVTYVFARDAAAPSADKPDDDKKPDADAKASSKPAPGPWKLVDNDKFENDAFDGLVRLLARLRAENWVADDQAPGDGAIEVTLERAEGSPVVIKVDAKSRHASVSDVNMPLELPEPTVKAIDGEYRYRTIIPVRVDQITSVTVTRDEKAMTIERDDAGAFKAGDAKINSATVGRLFDALAGLRVERFIAAPAEPAAADAKPALSIVLKTKDDKTVALDVLSLKDETRGQAVLKGETPTHVKLSDATVKSLEADVTAPPSDAPPGFPQGLPPGLPPGLRFDQ